MPDPFAVAPDPLAVAIDVAQAAGRLLLDGFVPADDPAALLGRRHAAETKGSAIDLVTEYDRRAEGLITEALTAAFPLDALLAEEGGARGPVARSRWIVDPLDGTTNFAHGLPFFCVAIARETEGHVELGVIEAPALRLSFVARRGHGATCNGQPLAVSDTAALERAMLATGFPYDRHTSADDNLAQFVAFEKRARAVRRFGSAALDLALVAHGLYDGYWEMKLKPWDLAAGTVLVEEAGGRVSGWRGEPYAPESCALVASNGPLHQPMLDVLAQVGVPEAAR